MEMDSFVYHHTCEVAETCRVEHAICCSTDFRFALAKQVVRLPLNAGAQTMKHCVTFASTHRGH